MKNGKVLLSMYTVAAVCIAPGAIKASSAATAYGDGIATDRGGRAHVSAPSASTARASGATASRPWPKWLYNEWREGPSDTVTRYAEILSDNAVRVRRGHGTGSRLAITLRSSPDGDDVILTLSKGHFVCAQTFCQIVARFDNGAILGYSGSPSAPGSADAIYLNERPGFLANIRKARSLVIRAELEKEGMREFAFDIVGLRWP